MAVAVALFIVTAVGFLRLAQEERTESFEEAVVLAVNLGDDADSVGAVTGQLAGALYGMSGIPARWLEQLAWRGRLAGAADARLAGAVRK